MRFTCVLLFILFIISGPARSSNDILDQFPNVHRATIFYTHCLLNQAQQYEIKQSDHKLSAKAFTKEMHKTVSKICENDRKALFAFLQTEEVPAQIALSVLSMMRISERSIINSMGDWFYKSYINN